MIATVDLVDGVHEHRAQGGDAIASTADEPGRLTMRVRPAMPAMPRDRIAVGTPCATP